MDQYYFDTGFGWIGYLHSNLKDMTRQNWKITAWYWGIALVSAFLIYIQHDESSDETVKYLLYLFGGVYIAAIIIYQWRRKRKRQ